MVFNENVSKLQKTDYYTFELEIDLTSRFQTLAARNDINRYNFLGKETQVATGYIELQARFYDPTIGRFMAIDPVTEGQDEFSPYHYSFNNPIRFSYPDGRFSGCCGGFGDFLTGVRAAVNENMGWGNPIKARPGYVEAYNAGRTAGYYVSVVAGVAEIAGGALGLGALAGAEVGSGRWQLPL